MAVLVLFFLFYAAANLFKGSVKAGKRKLSNKAIPAKSNLQTLYNLQAQRDDIADLLSEIEYKLDFAPTERTREKLIKDKIRLHGQLATVENKIYKLIN